MGSSLKWDVVGGRSPRRFIWATLCLVAGIGLFAGVGLAFLFRVQGKLLHAAATQEVVDRGGMLASYLAEASQGLGPEASDREWQRLEELFRALRHAEGGLEYVSVVRDGVTLFHRHAGGLGMGPGDGVDRDVGHLVTNVSAGLSVLDVGGEKVPVVVVSVGGGAEGGARRVELGIRRTVVGREESAVTGLVAAMFKLTIGTVVASFAVCGLLVLWVVRREVQHEALRREQEHLAFSGVLANGIVHDFRNPMSSLKLDVQMLGREVAKGGGADPARLGTLAERARGTIDRMDKVFQEFLYMAKPQAESAQESVDMGQCVRETVEMLKARFEQSGVLVELELPAQPALVRGLDSALRRALANVLVNAEQHSRRGGVVKSSVRVAGGITVVEVRDQGEGIPKGDRKKVFEMFYTTRPGGTGLGLFLAKAAVEKCGGSIEAADCADGALIRIQLRSAGERGGTELAGV